MVLIAVLLCLALQRVANMGSFFSVSWFEFYLKLLNRWLVKLNEWLALLLIIVPILAFLAMLHFLFAWRLFGLCNLILSTFILFLCIDTRSYKSNLDKYVVELEAGNIHEAASMVEDIIVINHTSGVTSSALCHGVTDNILLKSFERFFAGIFWFIVLGVYGVVIYFIVTLIHKYTIGFDRRYVALSVLAEKIQDLLDWIPARLVGISAALVGNFNNGFKYYKDHFLSGLTEARRFAVDSCLAALDIEFSQDKSDPKENYEALDLVNRILMIWIISIAVIFFCFLF